MRWAALLFAAGMLLLAGCHPHSRVMVLRDVPERPLRGNLVLGPAAEDAWLAEAYAGRSDWPSVDTGYRTDSVTIYTSTIYDVQSQYDRYGSLYAGGTTVQMGTWSR